MKIPIIGYSFYGHDASFFTSPSPPLYNHYYLALQKCIVEDIHIKESTTESPKSMIFTDDISQGILE